MSPILVGQILFVVIALLFAWMCFQVVMMWGTIIDSIYVWRAYVGLGLWAVNFAVLCELFGNINAFDIPIYAGLPWPYAVSAVFMFIPVINNTRVSGTVAVILMTIFFISPS